MFSWNRFNSSCDRDTEVGTQLVLIPLKVRRDPEPSGRGTPGWNGGRTVNRLASPGLSSLLDLEDSTWGARASGGAEGGS